MENEIEIARLVHYFIRGHLSEAEQDKLFVHLQNDPGLLDYIMMDALFYEYGLQKQKNLYPKL